METEINEKSKNQKEIEVNLSPEEVNEYGDKAAEIISSENSIDGFRPGKAPKLIVEEKVGKERLWKESCYQALKETYVQIIEKNNFFVVSPPEVQIISMEMDKPFTYKITVTLMPEISLPDYKKIGKEKIKEKKEIKVEEKEVDTTLESIQKSRAKVKSVSRESQKGDELIIDFQGMIDGVEQEALKAEKMNFILGEQKFIAGFEEEITGIKAGGTKEFSVEIDLPDSDGETSKKKVDFKVKVHSVNEREIPDLNDAFAISLGNFTDLNDLREKVEKNVLFEKNHKEKERIRLKIIEEIQEQTSVDIPESMIEKELDNMTAELKQQLSLSGLSFENYLKKMNKTEKDIRKDWEGKARKRIITGLILQDIAQKEKIEVSDEEVEKETNAYLNRMHQTSDAKPDQERLKLYIKDIIQNEKVFQILEGETI